MASGFRPQNTLNGGASEAPPLVISVVQNVITMSDMGKEDDGDPADVGETGRHRVGALRQRPAEWGGHCGDGVLIPLAFYT
jgi:hypothetical protein